MKNREIVLEGKNKDKLIEQGLRDISKNREDVEIEIIEKEKGFFGNVKKYQVIIRCAEDCPEVELVKDEEVKPFFEISFLDDGVYLTLNKGGGELTLETVVDILQSYRVEGYSEESLKKGYYEYSGIAFKVAEQQEKGPNEKTFININSSDGMKAYVIIFEECEKSADEIVQILREKIKRPIDLQSIEDAIDQKIHNKPILISEGVEPVDGKDGYIDYKFEFSEASIPKINQDGSADFKDLGLITTVEADTVVAEKIAPVEGRDGESVLGEKIEHISGKEAMFKYGKNLKEIEAGTKLVSEVDGQVKLEDDKINMYEVYEIKGNVDNSVGNIDFKGSVIVRGNVISGFSVKCKGDLEVDGVVESCKVKSEGNIIVKRGILGSDNCEIIAKGTIYSKYIESAYVFSEELVEAEMILHSSIVSRGSILASGKKGAIMGGRIRAKSEVRAKSIGAVMATPTVIEVGIDPHLKRESELLRTGMDSIEGDIYKLDQVVAHLKGSYDSGALDEKKRSMYENAVRTREELEKKLIEMEKMADKYNYEKNTIRGRVAFSDVIHPGVKIIMGNSTYQVDQDIVRSTIYRDQFEGEIKVGPFIEE